jgi:2-oxoacid:acceptor oxidoreductase delta subunit (pyruvate/2-ketoisovalerate family)
MGITFEIGKGVRDATHLQDLLRERDAVFLACGALKSKPLGIPDERAHGVLNGLDFLRQIASGQNLPIGRRVLIVGGGNTAIDAARTARRLDAEVTLLYRRTRAEMPAFPADIATAEAEGVRIEMLMTPARVILNGNRACGLECVRVELGSPDETGRRSPVPIEGSETSFDAETIIVAIGEEIDLALIPSALHLVEGRVPARDGGQTEWRNLFIGGDFMTPPHTVVAALASGKRSAIAIDARLRGESSEEVLARVSAGIHRVAQMSRYLAMRTGKLPATVLHQHALRRDRVLQFEDLNLAYFTPSAPREALQLAPAERTGDRAFAEVEQPLAEKVRAQELARCFHCGRCTDCDNCFIYCPDIAVLKRDRDFEVDLAYCKGCGICVQECPRAAMEMIEEPTEF